MATFNLADLFELVADAAPDREAVVTSERRLSFAELDERATRVGNHLLAAGIEPGEHVGVQLTNSSEYLEVMLGCFKARAVPINVNYRYVESELAYLFDDADLVALVYHRQFAPRVAGVIGRLPALRHLVVVEDGTAEDAVPSSVAYERALRDASAARTLAGARSGDDRYVAYTGGTTGMPKGVVWRQEDIFFAAMGGGDPLQSGDFITAPEQIAERVPQVGVVSLQTPPLMHVSAQWGAFGSLFGGGKVVFAPGGRFDPEVIWLVVGAEKVNVMMIVGDAMARPLIDAYAAAAGAGRPYDTASLFVIGSGGAVLSPTNKVRLTELLPHVMVIDGLGSSETGVVGTRAVTAGAGEGPRFMVNEQTTVLDESGRPVAAGSGTVGRLARRGRVPLGYYGDDDKTAATFVVIDGERWVLPGDLATVDRDGSVVLLGRGSTSINTGGEKVYPEEVESTLKAHPDVIDAVVVGVPDERWGERVVAVVQTRAGVSVGLDELREHCGAELASYKLPRALRVVDEVVRSPAGKADYRWARTVAAAETGAAS